MHQAFLNLKCAALGILLAVCAVSSAHAQLNDTAVIFKPAYEQLENLLFPNQKCAEVINRSWRQFSGNGIEQYRSLEKTYMDNANRATLCALRRGYMTYLLLGEVEKQRIAGVVKESGLDAALNAAWKGFQKLPVKKFNEFMGSESCNASTPRIQFSDYFTNVVNMTCTTAWGPAVVDLRTMHITVAGKDFWNGPTGNYFGRNLATALGLSSEKVTSGRAPAQNTKSVSTQVSQPHKTCKTVTRYERRPFHENVCDYNQHGPTNCRNVVTRYDEVPIQTQQCN